VPGDDGAGASEALDSAAVHEEAQPLFNFRKTFGDYELLDEIARGGMGVVYHARQISLNRSVAIKMILAGRFASQEQALRFRAEAEAAARLRHQNIVTIHETGEIEGQPFLSMEYVEGGNLATLVRDRPLPGKRAALLVKTIAEAVEYAHNEGLLHRDLKPSNILLDGTGQPRITDFGLARRVEKESFLTVTGQVLGSPNFMPPEQAGARSVKAGRYSDVYSLGGILFYLLTGRPPFVGETVSETLQQVLHAEPVAPRLLNPAVPLDLATICIRCLQKEPGHRFATARALAEELGRFLRAEPINSRPVSALEKTWRWCKRKPALATAISASVIMLLVVSIGIPVALVRIAAARREAEQNLYVANVHQANESIESYDLGTTRESLRRIELSQIQWKMRGWEWRYLTDRTHGEDLGTIGRHESWLANLTLSPERRRLATISEDGVVQLRDLRDGTQIAQWSAHTQPVRHQPDSVHHALVFTLDGTLITAGQDRAVRFWDPATQRERYQITGLTDPVNGLALSPDSKLLVGQTDQGFIYFWKLTESAAVLITSVETSAIVSAGMAFAPDGKTLFAAFAERPLLRFDLSSPESPRQISPWFGVMPPVLFTDDRHVVTGDPSGQTLRLWTWPQLTPVSDLRVKGGAPLAIASSPDHQFLAAGLSGGQINIWDLASGGSPEARVLLGHTEWVRGLRFAPIGESTKLISIGTDKTIRSWDISNASAKEIVVGVGAPVRALAISPDERYLAIVVDTPSAQTNSEIRKPYTLILRELGSQRPVSSVSFGAIGLGPQVVFSPDGREVSVTDFYQLEFYDVPTLSHRGSAEGRGLVYASDNRWLAYVNSRGIMKRSFSGAPEEVLVPKLHNLQQLAVSPDHSTLACSTDFGEINLWDAKSGRSLGILPPVHTVRVTMVEFSADGRTLMSAGWDGRLALWDITHRKLRGIVRAHNNSFVCAVISPDGQTIATGGDDLTVRLWSVAQCQELAVLHGHTDLVRAVAFSGDGHWLASGSADGRVQLRYAPGWTEISTGEQSPKR
jgi:WD40 repeat protein